MEVQPNQQITAVPQKSKTKPVLVKILMVVMIALSGGGTYYWQHTKLQGANNQLSSIKVQNTKLTSELSSVKSQTTTLQDQYNQAKATLDSYQVAAQNSQVNKVIVTQTDLKLVVNGAQYVNPDGTVTQNGKWFGVNVTLVNNTSSTVSIKDSDFHLKDAQGNEYPEQTTQGASTLPDGWVALPNQMLAPGQTLRGTVIFQMTSSTVKSFSFLNVYKAYPINSSN